MIKVLEKEHGLFEYQAYYTESNIIQQPCELRSNRVIIIGVNNNNNVETLINDSSVITIKVNSIEELKTVINLHLTNFKTTTKYIN